MSSFLGFASSIRRTHKKHGLESPHFRLRSDQLCDSKEGATGPCNELTRDISPCHSFEPRTTTSTPRYRRYSSLPRNVSFSPITTLESLCSKHVSVLEVHKEEEVLRATRADEPLARRKQRGILCRALVSFRWQSPTILKRGSLGVKYCAIPLHPLVMASAQNVTLCVNGTSPKRDAALSQALACFFQSSLEAHVSPLPMPDYSSISNPITHESASWRSRSLYRDRSYNVRLAIKHN